MRPLVLVLALSGCGGAAVAAGDPVGTSGPLPGLSGQRAEGSFELTLRRADGTFVEVGDLRGEVVVLVFFATFDAMSQMQLTPLRAIAERHPSVRIVGVAAQPSARLLIEAYEHALEPPFTVTYDPEETVTDGTSMVGELEAVPTIVVLDRRGVPAARHIGFADEDRLEAMLRRAGG